MPGRLSGQVALVTGAGSGIGEASARLLAEEGANLVLVDSERPYLDELAPTLAGGPHRVVVGDVAEEVTAERMVAEAREAFGRVDALVAGVGRMFIKDVTETTVEEFDQLMAVNVRGMFLACKHAIPPMLERGQGAIAIVSSVSAYRGQEFDGTSSFAYNISKAAVRQLATSLATRYAAEGLRVNSIAPGVTRTAQLRHAQPDLTPEAEEQVFRQAAEQAVPMGRYAGADEIAAAILFLLSNEASYVTGTTLLVDGGLAAR